MNQHTQEIGKKKIQIVARVFLLTKRKYLKDMILTLQLK